MLHSLQLHVRVIADLARIWVCNSSSLLVCPRDGLLTLHEIRSRKAEVCFWACTGVEYSVLYARGSVLGPILGQHP